MLSNLNRLPRVTLTTSPTPLHALTRLSENLAGPEVWIKRDDLTTLAMGGNKVRKLEFLLGEALSGEADVILTAGGPQSNHCRLTAAACAAHGLECHLVLGGDPTEPPNGNALLDELCGATTHYVPREERNSHLTDLTEAFLADGRKPYMIPIGGSTGVGALGYVAAMAELCDQWPGDWNELDAMVCATSSGGTQAGLTLGARLLGYTGSVLGISVDQPIDRDPLYQQEMADIANESACLIDSDLRVGPDDFQLNADYLGLGYGILGPSEIEAIQVLAQREGIFLDPVYAGRAIAGLLDLIRKGAYQSGQKILFWHTGGAPALFAYADDLCDR